MTELADLLSDPRTWWGARGLVHRAGAHLELALLATAIAMALALPLGIAVGHRRRGGAVVAAVVNVGRSVPTYAVIAILFPITLRARFGDLGFWAGVGGLVLLALPPLFANTYVGMTEVDRSLVESARAMGLRPLQVVRSVELPVALPLVLTGVRTAAVQVMATATLASVFGYNALGSFLLEGLTQQDTAKLVTGAAAVSGLSVLTDAILGVAQRLATPWVPTRRRRFGRSDRAKSAPVVSGSALGPEGNIA